MAVMRLSTMNVVQQGDLAALKVHEAEGVTDSFRDVGLILEGKL
jgi:hypothetical protein